MRILLTESQVLNLLNEDMGVSRSTIPYVNMVYNTLIPKIESMVYNKKSSTEIITIGLDKIRNIILGDEDLFIDFPVEEIEVNLSLLNEKKEIENHYSSGGSAYPLDEKTDEYSYMRKPSPEIPKKIKDEIDLTMNALIDIEIYIDQKFEVSKIDDLLMDVRDTIMHEMLHLYEFYKRWLSSGKGSVNVTKTFAGRKNPNIPRENF